MGYVTEPASATELRSHLAADTPEGHGIPSEVFAQASMSAMSDRHGALHDEGAAHTHAAGKSATALPADRAAMCAHMEASPPGGHGTPCDSLSMADMTRMHDTMHSGGFLHTHTGPPPYDPQMKSSDLPVSRALKFTALNTIEGLAIPFGGLPGLKGRDTDGERFDQAVDLCEDWFPNGRPLLYHHGLHRDMKAQKVGRQTEYETREEGIFAQSQLDVNARYRKAIDELIEQEALGYSSGAYAHLARKNAQNVITRWPWVELSLTPIPANPLTLGPHYVKSSDLLDHLAGGDLPADLVASALKALDDLPNDEALSDGASFAESIDRLVVDGVARLEARKRWRAKSGRVLSAATRERLATHPQALRQLADDLDELLASADAPSAAKAALWSAVLEAQAFLARASLPTESRNR